MYCELLTSNVHVKQRYMLEYHVGKENWLSNKMIIIAKLQLNVIYYGYFVQITTITTSTRQSACLRTVNERKVKSFSMLNVWESGYVCVMPTENDIKLLDFVANFDCLAFFRKKERKKNKTFQNLTIEHISSVFVCQNDVCRQ